MREAHAHAAFSQIDRHIFVFPFAPESYPVLVCVWVCAERFFQFSPHFNIVIFGTHKWHHFYCMSFFFCFHFSQFNTQFRVIFAYRNSFVGQFLICFGCSLEHFERYYNKYWYRQQIRRKQKWCHFQTHNTNNSSENIIWTRREFCAHFFHLHNILKCYIARLVVSKQR